MASCAQAAVGPICYSLLLVTLRLSHSGDLRSYRLERNTRSDYPPLAAQVHVTNLKPPKPLISLAVDSTSRFSNPFRQPDEKTLQLE
jgi:hypothetical protein